MAKENLRQFVQCQEDKVSRDNMSHPATIWRLTFKVLSYIIDDERLKSDNLFDHQEIKKKWEEHLSGRDWSQSLWTIAMFNYWLDKNR